MTNSNPIIENSTSYATYPGVSRILTKLSSWFAIAFAFALPISTTGITIFQLLSIITMLAAGHLKQKFSMMINNRVALLLLALFILFALGCIYSTAPMHDTLHMLKKNSKIFLAVLMLPIFSNEKCRRYSINAFVAATLLTLFLSYLKLFGLFHYRMDIGYGSIFKNHIETSFVMVMGLYFIAYKFFTSNFKKWWPLGLLIPLYTYNILFVSAGRTGYVIYFVMLFLLGWQLARWKSLFISVAALAILSIAAFLLSPTFNGGTSVTLHNIKHYQQSQSTSVGLRIQFVKESLGLIKKHPIFGTGTGSLQQQVADIKPKPLALTSNPHNEYLNIGVQLGLVGLLAFLAILFYALKDAQKLTTSYMHLVQCIVAVTAVGSLANSWLMDTTEGHFFTCFLMLAFASGIKTLTKPNHDNTCQ